jgi:hypothetical protein
MPDFDKTTKVIKPGEGFKMPKPSIHEGTQGHTDAKNAARKASVNTQKIKGPKPGEDEFAQNLDHEGSDHTTKQIKEGAVGDGYNTKKEKSPGTFLMKAAGMVIGANKRRQAGKDAQDKAKADAYASFGSKKLS